MPVWQLRKSKYVCSLSCSSRQISGSFSLGTTAKGISGCRFSETIISGPNLETSRFLISSKVTVARILMQGFLPVMVIEIEIHNAAGLEFFVAVIHFFELANVGEFYI